MSNVLLTDITGWLTWLLETRNSLDHRPRQIVLYQPKQIGGPQVLTPSLQPLDRLQVEFYLWRSPELSWVEALAASTGPADPYLPDSGTLLVDRIFTSAVRFSEAVAVLLADHWSARRSESIVQHRCDGQWKSPRLPSGFQGFDATASGFETDAMIIHPATGDRMEAAHILPDQTRTATWQSKSA